MSQQQVENAGGKKLWGGRFSGHTDPLMDRFNASIEFDKKLYAVDLIGSMAYAKALQKVGILTESELQQLLQGLSQVKEEWERGTFQIVSGDEDIHTANERRLKELIGAVSGKLHTGRSRNDQVATDMRLWLREECRQLESFVKGLIKVIVERAETELDIVMPGYTHLQRAQPIRWSHFLLSYAWSFQADLSRLTQVTSRVNQLPLGSGALAGNPFNVDREFLAKELGFEKVIMNSLYAVSDRDFVSEFLGWATLTMMHVSRLAEDLICYSSAEFGFVSLADAYSTGSSLMPQKKNPDSLELLRGKAGRVFGQHAGFLMTYKGLPSTYNKDLQEDKEPMFDAAETLQGCIQILSGVLATMKVDAVMMKNALSDDMLATDLADYLVRKGVPFRETHHISGAAVKLAEDRNVSMAELSLSNFKSLHPAFEKDVFNVWDFESSIEKRASIGGTSRATVLDQIESLKQTIA